MSERSLSSLLAALWQALVTAWARLRRGNNEPEGGGGPNPKPPDQ